MSDSQIWAHLHVIDWDNFTWPCWKQNSKLFTVLQIIFTDTDILRTVPDMCSLAPKFLKFPSQLSQRWLVEMFGTTSWWYHHSVKLMQFTQMNFCGCTRLRCISCLGEFINIWAETTHAVIRVSAASLPMRNVWNVVGSWELLPSYCLTPCLRMHLFLQQIQTTDHNRYTW